MQIKNLTVNLSDERTLIEIVAQHLKLSPKKIFDIKILHKAIDARRRNHSEIKFVYNLAVNEKSVEKKSSTKVLHSTIRPIVIGFGPAGMFAGLKLAEVGLRPIIFERGADIDTRTAEVQKFFNGGGLNEKTNVQFGEGGAGTFSDGKLTTRVNDELIAEVLQTFVEAGAPEEILYLQKPHIGTDNLKRVVKNIREKIITLGGEVFFNAQVTDLEIKSNKVKAVIVNNEQRFESDKIFIATGHSARDTYEMLNLKGVQMETKAFAIGVRIEHSQEFINQAQYGEDYQNPKLPVADYFMTYKDEVNGRGAYTFCMCPGGQVIAASSELNRVVTNGMSNFKRDSGIANSAVLVNVTPNDFVDFGHDALNGMRFQRHYESLAFDIAGKNYYAPVQTVGDFLKGNQGSTQFQIQPTYPIGVKAVDLHNCLPKCVTDTLELALKSFDKKIKGFANEDVVMTGIESRTSAPCRIIRSKETYQSINVEGLYPIGEGAGYAGGIMSSAVDGLKVALWLINKKIGVK